jgi:thiamine kinase-like enzyme
MTNRTPPTEIKQNLSELWGKSIVQSALFNHYDLHLGNVVFNDKQTPIFIDQDRALSDEIAYRNDLGKIIHFNDTSKLAESVAATLTANLILPIPHEYDIYEFTKYVTINQGRLLDEAKLAMGHFHQNKAALLADHPEFASDVAIIGLRGQALVEQLYSPNLIAPAKMGI